METLYKKESNQAYSINETFSRRLDEEHQFVSTRHGGWVILDQEEYEKFKSRQFDHDSELFKDLKEAGIILTEDSLECVKSDLRKRHSRLLQPSTYHVIPVAEACNLNCVYCHPDAKPGKGLTDRDMAEEIVEFILSIPNLKHHSIKFVLTGGEPLLNFDIVRFITERGRELADENDVKLKISLQSNLTVMDDEIAKFLKKNGISVGTSLDGPKELHNKHRPYQSGKGSYEDVVYWIKRLKRDFGVNAGAISVMSKMSLDYNPQEVVDTFRRLNQREIFIKPFRPQGRAKENDKLEMTPESFFQFYKGAMDYILALNKKGETIRERTTREYVENFLSPTRNCMCRDRPCGAGTTMLSWTRNGDIYACDTMRSEPEAKLGNVKQDSYLDIRAAALPLVSMTNDVIPECTQCAYNAFCGTCPGNAFGEMDDPLPKPPLNFECQWQKRAFDYIARKFLVKEDRKILEQWASKSKQSPTGIKAVAKRRR